MNKSTDGGLHVLLKITKVIKKGLKIIKQTFKDKKDDLVLFVGVVKVQFSEWSFNKYYLMSVILFPAGHLAMSLAIFDCHYLGKVGAKGQLVERPGM